MQKQAKRVLAKGLALTLALTMTAGVFPSDRADAAKKPKLSTNKVTVSVKKSKKIKIKNVKAKKVKKLSVSSSKKKIAAVKKNGKTAFTITGKKNGKATVTAKITVKGAKKVKTLKVKVTVTNRKDGEQTTAAPSAAPQTTAPTSPSAVSSASPSVTESAAPSKSESPIPTERAPYVKKALNTNISVTINETAKVENMKPSNARITSTEVAFEDNFENSVIALRDESNPDAGSIVDGVIGDRQCGEKLEISNDGKDGSKCLKVSNRDRSFDGVRIDLENVGNIISKGGTYRFTADVKYGDNATGDSLVFSSERQAVEPSSPEIDNKVYENLDTKDAPTDWTTISGEFTVPDSFFHYAIYLENTYSSGTRSFPDILLDNVKIECLDKVSPIEIKTSLYETYKDVFDYVGTACGIADIMGKETMDFMKSQYNCVTPGNEMKMDAIMKVAAEDASKYLIAVDDVKDNKDYYIPEGYAEDKDNWNGGKAVVPILDFTNVDAILKEAKTSGIKIRMHNLLWHEQNPIHFFQKEYKDARSTPIKKLSVSPETMDKRIEFYIRSVMGHVLNSEYADVIYAWDVVNEYFHSHEANKRTKPTYYEDIYNTYVGVKGEKGVADDKGTQSGMTTEPEYVRLAFEIAHDELVKHNRTDIKLYYNDFNTYQISEDICNLVNYLNYWGKICDGVGMQAHLDLSFPGVKDFKSTLEMFRVNIPDVEIQITELDATMNWNGKTYTDKGETDEMQAAYYYDIMRSILDEKKAGANITGVIFWSLYDGVSWRAAGKPCIFNGLNSPKSAYYAVIDVKNAVK